MLIAAGGAREMAQACALLSERHYLPARSASTTSDLLSALDDWRTMPPHVQRVAKGEESFHLPKILPHGSVAGKGESLTRAEKETRPLFTESDFRRAVLAGYPDRVAQRREPLSPRVRLASGAGAVIGPESGVRDGEFLVALDVQTGHPLARLPAPNDARIRLASRVEREWLQPNQSEIVHRFDPDAGIVRAAKVERYDALVLAEHPTKPDGEIAAGLLADAWIERGPRAVDEQLLRRLAFAGRTADVDDLVRIAVRGARSLDDVQLARALDADVGRALDRDAPESLAVPSGRTVRLEYSADGGVSAAVKLQELFGLGGDPTPRSAHACPCCFRCWRPTDGPFS